MGWLKDYTRGYLVHLKWILAAKRRERSSKKRAKELYLHLSSLDQALMLEYDDLLEAYEKEQDPIKRYRIISGILELEKVLENRQALMQDLSAYITRR
ncbi:MAG: hypothetical protein K6T91_10940 [Firmicutes bacterium]|nr:hypothetical protein [Bacillota bacterium]